MASNTIIKGVHVSFDIVDHFAPRIPKQRCPEEDATISRICVAENLTMAINALPQSGDVINLWRKTHRLACGMKAPFST